MFPRLVRLIFDQQSRSKKVSLEVVAAEHYNYILLLTKSKWTRYSKIYFAFRINNANKIKSPQKL